MPHHSKAPRCTIWLRALRGSCVVSVVLCAALLAASIATAAVSPSETARTVRAWMLQAGLPLLMLSMGIGSLAIRRLEKVRKALDPDPELDFVRSRERLYFVAAVAALVSLPSAVLGLLWATGPRPGNDFVIRVIEMFSLGIIGWLLLRNTTEACRAKVAPARVELAHPAVSPDVVQAAPAQSETLRSAAAQSDELPERSINSIR